MPGLSGTAHGAHFGGLITGMLLGLIWPVATQFKHLLLEVLMTLEQLIKALTPEIYQNLRTAIELGRWPDGRKLEAEQRELCMEAG